MKKLLSSLVLAVGLSVSTGYSQDIPPTPTGNPLLDFLSQGSNFVTAVYGIYDTDSKSYGGGIGLGYRLSPYVVPVVRLDQINNEYFVPSGNLQLQVPIPMFRSTEHPDGLFSVTPFIFSGAATTVNAPETDGNVIGIFGAGAYIRFDNANPWLPDYILGDYEHWTGGGFDNDQVRFGFGWKLGW